MAKYVYFFGGKSADGNGKMKELLGGKGANLAEMCHIGLPVPAGFTISTECCDQFYRSGRRWPAGLEDAVIAVIGSSEIVGGYWSTPLGLLFIDGGHGELPAHQDYETWVPHLGSGGLLAIHDVFADPRDGGRPPYELYCEAVESGLFQEIDGAGRGSLRVLRRTDR